MRLFWSLLAAVITVHGAPSVPSHSLEPKSPNRAAVGLTAVSSSPFVTFAGHPRRHVHLARYKSAPAISASPVRTTGQYSYVGCYTESTVQPALSGKSYADDSMTVELCAAVCQGFTWFGLENGRECYCGDALAAGSVPEAATGQTLCDIRCVGNAFELCGGSARLQMYNNINPVGSGHVGLVGTSSATSASSTIASSSSTRASTSISSGRTTLTTSTSTSTISSTSTAPTTSSASSTTLSTTSPTHSTTSKSSTTSKTSTTSTSSSTTSSIPPVHTPTGRAVFAHYMVSGITQDQANTDVQQAQAMGIDAFSLDVVTATASWSNEALQCLFTAADAAGFKLFLSFDMTAFSNPSDAIPLLQTWYSNSAYYKHNNLYFVSTFDGGTDTFGYDNPNDGWQAKYRDAVNSLGIPTYFVPAFDDSPVDPSSFFTTFPVVDGLFAWEDSWPWASDGNAEVSSSRDQQYFAAAKSAGKTFMMGISSVQFKHMSPSMNYYRTGRLDLALRIPQILSLGPDFVEIQSWNDAGESHYIGQIWPYALSGTNVGSYTNGYDHSGWQILLTPFIAAYKAGITDVTQLIPTGGSSVQGVFWHSTLLSTASCSGDGLGKPSGSQNLQDTISVAVIIAPGVSGVTVNVFSGGQKIASYNANQGLNAWEVGGMVPGQVQVVVGGAHGSTLLSATGPISVQSDSSNCNYNPQVVPLS